MGSAGGVSKGADGRWVKERRWVQSMTRSARMKEPSENAREGNAVLAGMGEKNRRWKNKGRVTVVCVQSVAVVGVRVYESVVGQFSLAYGDR